MLQEFHEQECSASGALGALAMLRRAVSNSTRTYVGGTQAARVLLLTDSREQLTVCSCYVHDLRRDLHNNDLVELPSGFLENPQALETLYVYLA